MTLVLVYGLTAALFFGVTYLLNWDAGRYWWAMRAAEILAPLSVGIVLFEVSKSLGNEQYLVAALIFGVAAVVGTFRTIPSFWFGRQDGIHVFSYSTTLAIGTLIVIGTALHVNLLP